MSIAKQEKELFAQWEKVRNPFVRDGVVCEEAYQDSKLKIAFVLKEYSQETDGNYDLRENELKNPCYMWLQVARVLHGIRMLDLPPDEQQEFVREMHQSICAFNLDKTGGHSQTVAMRLALVAMKDQKFIQDQFAIYDPDLTICCGINDTFEIFQYAVGQENYPKENTSQGMPWYQKSSNKYVVGINHPAWPGWSHTYTESVICAIKEICQQNEL